MTTLVGAASQPTAKNNKREYTEYIPALFNAAIEDPHSYYSS